VIETPPRWFFWPAHELTHRWRPVYLGGDEFGRRTIGLRVPGGVLWLPLWRFHGWQGPCPSCGQWEPPQYWRGDLCQICDSDRTAAGYVSRLWAEDWDCPEDSVYDDPKGER